MTTHTERTVPALLGLSIVLSVAIFFRFYGLADHLVFATDQGRALLAGRNILLGDWIIQGPSTSVNGLSLGPLYYYMTAIALWFSHFHPIGPAIMVAGTSVLTAGFLYLYVWKNWKEKSIAVMAGLAFALSPLVNWQARIAIEPTPLPLIVIAWLWAITEAMRHQSKKWWVVASFLPFIGAQFNFSAVVLWVAQALMLLIITPKISILWKNRILALGGTSAMGLLIGKFLWSSPTTLSYWTRQWTMWTFPEQPLTAIILFIFANSTIVFWLFSWIYRWYYARPQNIVRVIMLSWILVSVFAFTIKTVGGDHALGLIFLAPAIVIPLGVTPLLKLRDTAVSVLGCSVFFLLWAIHALPLINQSGQLTLQDHNSVVDAIKILSQGQPYNLVYRGHLDVYDAADDHYQYLLWYKGIPPAQSARIALQAPYFEHWLYPKPQASLPVARTFYLYYPAQAVDRYGQQGLLYKESEFAIDIVE